MEDRLMSAKQLAEYLSVNERTVLKLVSDGVLPGLKVGNQWRFRKAMVDTWLDDQMLGVLPRHVDNSKFGGSTRQMLELASCFDRSHIIPDLVATTRNGVVEELASIAHQLGLVRDRTWLVGAIIERENVMPSAVGNGVAFLHTLRRNPEQVTRPFMVFGRSRSGIDFDALDGKPTYLFFLLGLKFQELHLPWLCKLSQMLAREEAVGTLLEASDSEAIHGALVKAERLLEPGPQEVRRPDRPSRP